jgi:H+-transporting ATPase
MSNFITYRISATLQLLLFFFIALFAFKPQDYVEDWPEFFHMPVIMLMLITLLNDGTFESNSRLLEPASTLFCELCVRSHLVL